MATIYEYNYNEYLANEQSLLQLYKNILDARFANDFEMVDNDDFLNWAVGEPNENITDY